jgi:hypothetical protein
MPKEFISFCGFLNLVTRQLIYPVLFTGAAVRSASYTKTSEADLNICFSFFVHNGEPKLMKIKGVPGITERENKWGPFDLPAAHIFKIRSGKIYEIEAIGYIAKHGIKNGWE